MRRALFAALVLGAAAPARPAQPSAPPAAPAAAVAEFVDPASLAAARELLVALDFDALVATSARQSTQAAFTTILREMEAQLGEGLPDALEARFRAILEENTEAVIVDLRATGLDDSARVYARHFTLEEIRELRRIQTLPVMVKFQRVAPQFTAELTQIGLDASARRMPALMRRIASEVEAWRRANPAPTAAEQ